VKSFNILEQRKSLEREEKNQMMRKFSINFT
jgi:hypothetical protein